VLVVVLAEGVELTLQVRHGGGGRLAGQPAFLGLVESPGLALGLGRFGLPFLWVMPRAAMRHSKAFRPPPERAV
jgi:hypothetical protein